MLNTCATEARLLYPWVDTDKAALIPGFLRGLGVSKYIVFYNYALWHYTLENDPVDIPKLKPSADIYMFSQW